jgi:hypothetical protein
VLIGVVSGRAVLNGFVLDEKERQRVDRNVLLYPCYSFSATHHAYHIEALPYRCSSVNGEQKTNVDALAEDLVRRLNSVYLLSENNADQPVVLQLQALTDDGLDGLAIAQPQFGRKILALPRTAIHNISNENNIGGRHGIMPPTKRQRRASVEKPSTISPSTMKDELVDSDRLVTGCHVVFTLASLLSYSRRIL